MSSSSSQPSAYWFISAPGEPSKSDTVSNLRAKIANPSSTTSDLAEVFTYSLPEFKIGTLDQLVVLSDELAKIDTTVESVVVKLSDNLRSLFSNNIEQWKSSLVVNDKPVDSHLKGYQWNTMKYRTDKSLRELTDMITQEVHQIESLMKNKLQNYNTVKSHLASLQRKQTGNLSTRSLADMVKKEYFVLDSEYLTTLLVAVPKAMFETWMSRYETITPMVVPRSSAKIAEDNEFGLFTVTLFQKVVTDFTNKCREERFVVRDFQWNEEAILKEKRELMEIGASEKELWASLVRLGKMNFGEAFSCWCHIKALRVYVESILRYGLPPNFQPMIVKPKPKTDRKAKDTLIQHYAKLGGSGSNGEALDENAQSLLVGMEKDYFPFVYFAINWNA